MGKKKYYQHPRYKRVYGDDMVSPIGRIVRMALVEPREPNEQWEDGKPRYEATLLLPKGSEVVENFLSDIEVMVDEMVAQYNQAAGKGTAKIAIDDVCEDGDVAEWIDDEKTPYYRGHYILVLRNMKQPKFLDRNKAVIDGAEIQGGMKVRTVITPHVGPTGVAYKLERVQLVADDGERFGGSTRNHDALLSACDEEGNEIEPKEADPLAPESRPARAARGSKIEVPSPARRTRTKVAPVEDDEPTGDEEETAEEAADEALGKAAQPAPTRRSRVVSAGQVQGGEPAKQAQTPQEMRASLRAQAAANANGSQAANTAAAPARGRAGAASKFGN